MTKRTTFYKKVIFPGATLSAIMLLCCVMLPSYLAQAATPKTPGKPNIILIMAHDIGAEAFGCYGGQSYETPRINSLAEEGIRFENAFAMPLCSPSRVCILSGRYPFRSSVTTNKGGGSEKFLLEFRHDPWGIGEQPEITFAHLLKHAGYKTAVAGKWGLAQFDHNPDHITKCGFDNYCAWARIYRNQLLDKYWVPTYIQDGKLHEDEKGVFGPDLYSDYLIDFSDVAPTLAELAGEKMPDDRVIDGISFAPQLYGEEGTPRQWVFTQNKSDIRIRNKGWALDQNGKLYDLRKDRYKPTLVPTGEDGEDAEEARRALSEVMKRFEKPAVDTYLKSPNY